MFFEQTLVLISAVINALRIIRQLDGFTLLLASVGRNMAVDDSAFPVHHATDAPHYVYCLHTCIYCSVYIAVYVWAASGVIGWPSMKRGQQLREPAASPRSVLEKPHLICPKPYPTPGPLIS